MICAIAAVGSGDPEESGKAQLREAARGKLGVEQANSAHRRDIYEARKIAYTHSTAGGLPLHLAVS
jgi:hypothetical protein